MPQRLVPQLVTALRGYTRHDFLTDLLAGVIVGIVALPLAIAFGIASGVTPAQGLYTAIIGGFVISALSGSRVQIGGPTGAFVVIVYGIVQQYGFDGLAVATLMAGIILVAMGLVRLGAAIKFIPYPVTLGFTAGIALIIAAQQVKDVLGLTMGAVPSHFIEKIGAYAANIGSVNWQAAGLSVAVIAVIGLWPRAWSRLPSPFVALIVGTVGAQLLGLHVETVGSRFGELSFSFPHAHWPSVSFADVRRLVSPAITIALLAAIESLLSAVVADGMTGERHRSNMELVAQGAANIMSPLFGGIPATGAIARTATNIRNGGRTPVAGLTHAVTLLMIALFLGKLAGFIPMAVLGAILLVVAYNMSEWRAVVNMMRAPKSDIAVLITTFLLTVVIDLTVAIEVGIVLAAFLFMRRMAEVTNVSVIAREFAENVDENDPNSVKSRRVPHGVVVYEINGPFFFGAAETFKDTLSRTMGRPKILILRLRHVPAIDATGMNALRDVVRRTRTDGTVVYLSDVLAQPMLAMGRSGLLDEVGEEHVFDTIDDALDRARSELGLPPAAASGPGMTPSTGQPAIRQELLRKPEDV